MRVLFSFQMVSPTDTINLLFALSGFVGNRAEHPEGNRGFNKLQ